MHKLFRTLVLSTTLLPTLPVAQAALAAGTSATGAPPISVTTYHYNNLRTGWNQNETLLNAAAFPSTFGVLATVALDDQVDAQPLLVPAQQIAGGTHDVLYVVTESNSIYALDANTGAILLNRNFGAPVPTPLGCGNNGPNVGITGTPVIDLAKGELFLNRLYQRRTPKLPAARNQSHHARRRARTSDRSGDATPDGWNDVCVQRHLSAPAPGSFGDERQYLRRFR